MEILPPLYIGNSEGLHKSKRYPKTRPREATGDPGGPEAFHETHNVPSNPRISANYMALYYIVLMQKMSHHFYDSMELHGLPGMRGLQESSDEMERASSSHLRERPKQ